jgi:hypothetical protein
MTKQEFIDKWKDFPSYILKEKFKTDLDELLAEQEDIEYERGYQHGWNDCSKGL